MVALTAGKELRVKMVLLPVEVSVEPVAVVGVSLTARFKAIWTESLNVFVTVMLKDPPWKLFGTFPSKAAAEELTESQFELGEMEFLDILET